MTRFITELASLADQAGTGTGCEVAKEISLWHSTMPSKSNKLALTRDTNHSGQTPGGSSYEQAHEDWDEKDCTFKHYINSCIPESVFIYMRSKTKDTGVKYFKALCELFKNQSVAICIEK